MALREFTAPELPRVNSNAARLVPILTTTIAALVTILPLQLPGYAALTPALALEAVYHWTLYRPHLLPSYALLRIGLVEYLLHVLVLYFSALVVLLYRL